MYNQNYQQKPFDERHLELMLDQVIRFMNAYKSLFPDEWCTLFLTVKRERTFYSPSFFVETGSVVFDLSVGTWWDGLLRQFPDVEDYISSIFGFNQQENRFTASILAGSCDNQQFPALAVAGMLHQSLASYETKHPELHFERNNLGAILKLRNT